MAYFIKKHIFFKIKIFFKWKDKLLFVYGCDIISWVTRPTKSNGGRMGRKQQRRKLQGAIDVIYKKKI